MSLRRVLDGLVVVAIGAILLGNTLGVLPWSVWWTILSLWPLLLISAGIDIVGKSLDNVWLRLLAGLLVLGGLAYGVVVGMTGAGGPEDLAFPVIGREAESREFSRSEPADPSVDEGSVHIEGGAGRIDVGAGDELLTAEGVTPFGTPVFRVDREGGMVDARVGPGEGRVVWPFGAESRLEVELSRDIRWNVRLDSGVSRVRADFSQLEVGDLRLDVGVSTADVTLGDAISGGSEARIDTGVSTVNLRVPSGAAVEVIADEGLATVNVPGGYERVGDDGRGKVWRSPEFDGGDDPWVLRVDAGVATVNINEY